MPTDLTDSLLPRWPARPAPRCSYGQATGVNRRLVLPCPTSVRGQLSHCRLVWTVLRHNQGRYTSTSNSKGRGR